MDKMKFETPDMVAGNIEKIGALFPAAITEMRPKYLSLNLTALDSESIVRQIAGDDIDASLGESLKEAVEQTQQREKLEKQIAQLKAKMKKGKQLGRQMELRREIMRLEKESVTHFEH